MAEGAYVGKYGEALRRLQAIESGMTGAPVGPSGPMPQTGAFEAPGLPSRLNPKYEPMPQTGPSPLQQAAPAQEAGAIEQAAQQPTQQSARQVVEDMTPAERNKMGRIIKKNTGRTVDQLYAQMVESGEIAPPAERKPNRKEKMSTLTEALLRFGLNMGSGMDGGGAAAKATLDTQGRRGAIEQAEIEEQNALAEGRRGEVQGVLSSRAARQTSLADKASERAWDAAKSDAAAQNASALQSQQDAAALERTKISAGASRSAASSAPVRVTMADGTVMERDPASGLWQPAQAMVEEETSGKRGVKFKTKRTGVLKVAPKADSGEVTAKDRQRMMNDAIAAIQKDTLTMARIRAAVGDEPEAIAAEVANRAQALVEESLAGAATLGNEYGDNPLD